MGSVYCPSRNTEQSHGLTNDAKTDNGTAERGAVAVESLPPDGNPPFSIDVIITGMEDDV